MSEKKQRNRPCASRVKKKQRNRPRASRVKKKQGNRPRASHWRKEAVELSPMLSRLPSTGGTGLVDIEYYEKDWLQADFKGDWEMNVLIVFTHPDGQSLNGALKDIAVGVLKESGHEVVVSDLYAKKFKAIADLDDFLVLKNPSRFNYISEQYHALKNNTFSADIIEEQKLVTWADLIIFQYPMWWTDAPAILKGWFDRIFSYGFAYGPGRYEEGNLKGKKAIVSVTHGAEDLSEYGETGIKGKVDERLFNIQHEKLYYCGMTVLDPFLFPAGADEETRLQHIEEWKQRLMTLK